MVYDYKGYIPEWGWRMVQSKLEELDEQGNLVWSNTGRPYRKRYLPPGQSPSNLWMDIGNLSGQSKERLGYPTQKPEALLERIIQASSNEGDVVLDPFCGCGTAVAAAQKLNRQWLGIDVTHLAVALMKSRLKTAFNLEPAPTTRWWANPGTWAAPAPCGSRTPTSSSSGPSPCWKPSPRTQQKRGADRGIDGII